MIVYTKTSLKQCLTLYDNNIDNNNLQVNLKSKSKHVIPGVTSGSRDIKITQNIMLRCFSAVLENNCHVSI